MEVSLALAFAAGLISFASPCVLALLPVYLAFLGQAATLPGSAVEGRLVTSSGSLAARSLGQPIVAQALLFVAGFSILFVLVGVSVGLLGGALFRVDPVRQAAGIAVIGIGLLTTGVAGPVLDRLRVTAPSVQLPAGRNLRSLALGALVAIGWVPCIGPVLGAILTMGASTQQAPVAAVLLVAYSAGLALPFVGAAFGLRQLSPLVEALRRHDRAVQVTSGLFIVAIGILIFLNVFARLASLFTFVL
jgi:cytochrome c-type biogenesis protein